MFFTPILAALIFVSNEDAGTISVIEGDRVAATVAVGKRPRGIRLSPDGRLLYVAVSGSAKAPPGVDESTLPPPDRRADGIAVVDVRARRLLRTLESGDDPEAFDLSPDGRRLYVSNEDAATMSELDTRSGRVLRRVAVGEEPEGVTTRPDGKVVYVTSEAEHRVDVVDAATLKVVARVPTGQRPRTIVFTRDGRRAYVSCERGGSVTIIDAVKHEALADVPVGDPAARPMGLALSADERTLYVSTGRGGGLAFLDVERSTWTRAATGVGARPWGVGLSADGRLYTANGPSNDVSIVDARTAEVLARVPAGASPWGIAVGR